MENRIKHLFAQSMEAKMAIADSLSEHILKASDCLIRALLKDQKILICGNGGSAANSLHFATAMMNYFEIQRPSLPVISLIPNSVVLTAFSNENHYEEIFSKQILTLGCEGDILLALSTTGHSPSILHAVKAAKCSNIDTIVLSGRDGGILTNYLGPEDIEIRVPVDNLARIREMHLFILHCFCDLIDYSLFGQMAN